MAKSTLSKEDAEKIQEIKNRLVRAAHRMRTEDGLCDSVYGFMYDAGYGKEYLDLGARPNMSYHMIEVEQTVGGFSHTSSIEYRGFTKEDATIRYMRDNGFKDSNGKPFALLTKEGDEKALDPSGDSDAVKAYKAKVREFAEKMATNGHIRKAIVNKYLEWVGIEPIPGRKRWFFKVPIEPITVDYVVYTGDGSTLEEGLKAAQEKLARDLKTRTTNPVRYLDYGTVPQGFDATRQPFAENAELTVDETVEPQVID